MAGKSKAGNVGQSTGRNQGQEDSANKTERLVVLSSRPEYGVEGTGDCSPEHHPEQHQAGCLPDQRSAGYSRRPYFLCRKQQNVQLAQVASYGLARMTGRKANRGVAVIVVEAPLVCEVLATV